MKLYVLENKSFQQNYETNKSELKFKIPITITGSSPLADEGDWSVPENMSQYFGQSSGWWTTKKDADGILSLWLMNDEDPNFISWLWRDMPTIVVNIQGVLKLPLFLGETGTGLIMPVKRQSYSIYWKVIERGF